MQVLEQHFVEVEPVRGGEEEIDQEENGEVVLRGIMVYPGERG